MIKTQNLTEKKESIAELIKIPIDEILVFSGQQENYRNRMDFAFHQTGLGLKEKGKWFKVVDVQESYLASEGVNRILANVRDVICRESGFDAFQIIEQTGTFKFAVIRCTNLSSSITFILNKESPRLTDAIELIKAKKDLLTANNVIIGYVTKEGSASISEDIEVIKGTELLTEEIGGKVFVFHSQGFFQVNEEISEQLVRYVRSLLEGENNDVLLDLYGGVGLFGVSCADLFYEVDIVESFEGSIELAEKNAASNSITNIRIHGFPVQRLDKLDVDKTRNIKIIIDPPRSGMTYKAIRKILKLGAERIIYVSCNPKKFAEEISKFSNEGYVVKSCALFDMFPQTKHIEMVVELKLSKGERM